MKWFRYGLLGFVTLLTILGIDASRQPPLHGETRTRIPMFVVDPYWPKPAPHRWVTEEVGATCVDLHDHVFTLNRGTLQPIEEQMKIEVSPPVIEYDQQGTVINSWGDRNKLPKPLHGCYFDHDNNLWLAGSGDGVVQKWTHDGSKLLFQIGAKGKCDGVNGECSSPGLNASHTLLNEPAAVAVDPANDDVYIADGYGNHRVVVFDKSGQFLRQWGSSGTAPGQFAPSGGGHPHCIVLNHDLLYVCDRSNDRIEAFDKLGNLKDIIPVATGSQTSSSATQDGIGTACDLALSPDGQYMYVDDIRNSVVWIFDRATRTALASFGRPGHSAGEFTSFHSMAVDSKGNIYTGEVTGRRIQKFIRKGFVPQGKLSTFLNRPYFEPRE